MDTKSLFIGISSFIAGGLLVSVAATTFEKQALQSSNNSMTASMHNSTNELKTKTGDDFDRAFINDMITHHQGAVDMAKVAQTNAQHTEIKSLAETIIATQEKEINDMKQWQKDWGYSSDLANTNHAGH